MLSTQLRAEYTATVKGGINCDKISCGGCWLRSPGFLSRDRATVDRGGLSVWVEGFVGSVEIFGFLGPRHQASSGHLCRNLRPKLLMCFSLRVGFKEAQIIKYASFIRPVSRVCKSRKDIQL